MAWRWYTTDGVERTESAQGAQGRQGPSGQPGPQGVQGPEPFIPLVGERGPRGPEGERGPPAQEPWPPEEPPWLAGLQGFVTASLHRIVVITTLGASTYVPDPGLRAIEVEVMGGGGNGGFAFDAGVGESSASGGGGAGGYARKVIFGPALAYPVSVGAVTLQTTFGSPIIMTGGAGGTAPDANAVAIARVNPGGNGGTASGGDINLPGNPGSPGIGLGSGVTQIVGGNGAVGLYGKGSGKGGQDAIGGTAGGFGAGGGGTSNATGSPDRAGGVGTQGIVIVREWV